MCVLGRNRKGEGGKGKGSLSCRLTDLNPLPARKAVLKKQNSMNTNKRQWVRNQTVHVELVALKLPHLMLSIQEAS